MSPRELIQLEDMALLVIGMQTETQRLENSWPHILRTALWPDLDKVIVAVAANGHAPLSVSLDLETAEALVGNLQSCIAKVKAKEHHTHTLPQYKQLAGRMTRGGNPPPDPQPQREG